MSAVWISIVLVGITGKSTTHIILYNMYACTLLMIFTTFLTQSRPKFVRVLILTAVCALVFFSHIY